MSSPPRAAFVALVCCLLSLASSAAAQSGAVPLRHLNHTAWTQADVPALRGAFRIARSNDGYLWINSPNGVLRFDGVRFVLLDSTASPLLKVRTRGEIMPLFVDRAGTLWLRRSDHAVLTYRDGTFRLAVPADTAVPNEITADGAGHIIAYSSSVHPRLVELRDGHAVPMRITPDITKLGITRIVPDTGRGMWVGGPGGLFHVVDGRAERIVLSGAQPNPLATPLVQTTDGTLWATGLGVGTGLERIVDGRAYPVRTADSAEIVDAYQAVEDSSGAVWLSTRGSGVLRWSNGRLESFTQRDGLSDVHVYDVSVDTHGVALLATGSGLDRLRPTPFITLDASDGIHVESPQRVVRDESGSLWTAGIDGHVVTEFRPAKRGLVADSVVATRAALPANDSYTVLGAARGGGVWIGTRIGEMFRYRDGHIDRRAQVPNFEGRALRFAVEDMDGDVWVGREQLLLALLHDEHFLKSPVNWASGVVQDSRGHVWVADADKPLLHEIVKGTIVRQFGVANGLPGIIGSVALERDDLLWAMTDSGIVRVANGRVSLVHTPSIEFVPRYGPELMVADSSLWFASDDRIGRIALASLHAAANGDATLIAVHNVAPSDGVTSPRRFVYQMGMMTSGPDNRLWFATPAGLAVFDPSRQSTTPAPTVRVEEIVAHGRADFDTSRATIAANPDRTTIHFATPDLAFPERDHLRYRLDGVDHEWIEAGAARLATYTQLRPGVYTFRIRAWTGDTLATPPREAALTFRVAPAWYQRLGLRILAVLLAAVAITVATILWQRRRARVATARLQAQFEVRLAERTRIARELHDTLLQGFTGLVLQLEGLRRTIDRSTMTSATNELSRILTLADGTLFDARQSVWDMRTPGLDERGLAAALETTCRDFAAANEIAFTFKLRGDERRLAHETEATALHVSREAMRNVVAHARASRVVVELRYEATALQLHVSDDGVGLSRHQLAVASSSGHFGILGMRERAAAAGGVFDVTTTVGDGTCVALTLPCSRDSLATSENETDGYHFQSKRARDARSTSPL
ncbi:MAG TPA: histidine kinase [Gemmatimonadaceae bacterium]|jgi:signal transduction histidine kinase/ligand-binding sensor domain-containing protein